MNKLIYALQLVVILSINSCIRKNSDSTAKKLHSDPKEASAKIEAQKAEREAQSKALQSFLETQPNWDKIQEATEYNGVKFGRSALDFYYHSQSTLRKSQEQIFNYYIKSARYLRCVLRGDCELLSMDLGCEPQSFSYGRTQPAKVIYDLLKDAYLERIPHLPAEVNVVRASGYLGDLKASEIREGAVFQEQSVLSTSVPSIYSKDQGPNLSFAIGAPDSPEIDKFTGESKFDGNGFQNKPSQSLRKEGYALWIKVPKGVRAMPIYLFPEGVCEVNPLGNKGTGENELLLPPCLQYKVISVQYNWKAFLVQTQGSDGKAGTGLHEAKIHKVVAEVVGGFEPKGADFGCTVQY